MNRFTIFASALTISAAAFATGAQADCASELAALKAQVGSNASAEANGSATSTQSASAQSSNGSSSLTDLDYDSDKNAPKNTPAGVDAQAANEQNQEDFTAKNAKQPQDEGQQSTGAVSGVAPTAALGKVASGSDSDTVHGNASASQSASSDNAGSGGADQSGQMASTSGSGDMDTGNTSAGSSSDMATGSTTGSSGGNTGAGGSDMVSAHIAAAQTALDNGNEDACMNAVNAARQAMQ